MSTEAEYQAHKAWAIAGLVAFMMLINLMDKVVLGLVSVPMMDELKLTPAQFGLIGGSLHWLFAVSAVIGGFLANRYPARLMLLVMAISWSLAQLPVYWANTLWLIIACRVFLGVGEGPTSPVATHALYKWFPNDRRNLPVAVMHQGSTLGLLLAGLMIPFVTAHWGWRANFMILAAAGLFWCLLWWRFGTEGRLTDRAGTNATASTAAPARLPYARLLRDRSVLGCYIGHFAVYWVLAVTLTWLPAYLQKVLGFESLQAGRMFAVFIAITTPISLGLAWWSQRLLRQGVVSRRARGIFLGLALLLGGLLISAQALPGLSSSAKFIVLALGAGMTQVMYSIGAAVIGEIVPAGQRSGMLAIGNGVSSLAGLSAPLVTGLLIQHASSQAVGYETGFLLCGGVLLLGGVAALAWIDPQRSHARLAQRSS